MRSERRWKRSLRTPRISGSAMAFKPSVAVLDACIFYPFHLRNIVVQAAVDRLIGARWAELYDDVPDIVVGSLANARRNLTKSRISASDFIGILRSQRLVALAQRA